MDIDLGYAPRLGDLTRLGGPAEAESAAERSLRLETLEAARQPRRTPAAAFAGRAGYHDDFLGFTVPLPTPLGELRSKVVPVEGSDDGRLDYEHFSVVMNAERRLALFVAVNIDGAAAVDVPRQRDRWSLDGRIPDAVQIGEDLYADNILDRGHLVRRQDPVWGASAARANDDTFHFTNCAPQAANFNQRTWLSLEDYVLDNARIQAARVTVFTGPIFRGDDRPYRGARIPTAYWKVLSFVGETGRPSSTAYMVDQKSELTELEATFGRFKTYQRSVLSIEHLTGLSFNGLDRFDGFSNEETATNTSIVAELHSPADIRL